MHSNNQGSQPKKTFPGKTSSSNSSKNKNSNNMSKTTNIQTKTKSNMKFTTNIPSRNIISNQTDSQHASNPRITATHSPITKVNINKMYDHPGWGIHNQMRCR